MNKQKTPITTIVTHVIPLSEIQEAFDKAIEAKDTIKVLVDVTK